MVTTCLPRLWACWVWARRAQTQQAQSLGRHVVTIPSPELTYPDKCSPDKCSPGQMFPRTNVPPDNLHTRTNVPPDKNARTCVARTNVPRTTGAASSYVHHLSAICHFLSIYPPSIIFHLSFICLSSVYHLSIIRPLCVIIYHLYVICQSSVRNLSIICM